MVVRRKNNRYFVYGTPWPGAANAACNEKAPLKKIFFLSKAKKNKLIPLDKREALRRIMTQSFFMLWNKEILDFNLRFCADLVKDTPCFRFDFLPDSSAAKFIQGKI